MGCDFVKIVVLKELHGKVPSPVEMSSSSHQIVCVPEESAHHLTNLLLVQVAGTP